MNKVYFDAKIQNLYGPDYEYLQDNVEIELKKIFNQTIKNPGVCAIIKGFNLRVSTIDPSTVMIYHVGGYGSLVSSSSGIIETTSSIDLISPSDPTVGVENYVYVYLYKAYGTFNKRTRAVVENVQRNIDLFDYARKYDRVVDKFEVRVYTQLELLDLTPEELSSMVFIGSFTANGGGSISEINLAGRVYTSTFITPETITEEMFNPALRMDQGLINHSDTYDDDYSGTPDTIEDDLNRIRTEIKEIKGTQDWEDSTDSNLSSFDFSVNALHPNGLIDFGNNFSCIPIPGGVRLLSGKQLMEGEVYRIDSYQDFLVDPADEYIVGDWDMATTPETHHVGNQPDSFTLVHPFISDLRIRDGLAGEEYYEGHDFTVVSSTGTVTTVIGGNIANKTLGCFYTWSMPRIDTLQLSSTGVFSIKKGVASYSPVPPNPDSGCMRMYYIQVRVYATEILESDLIDCRQETQSVRSVYQVDMDNYDFEAITPNKVTYYTDGGSVDSSFSQWTLGSTSTGAYVVTSTGGASFKTLIYSAKNGELWISATRSTAAGTVRVRYASVANSDTLDQTVDIDLNDIHTINNVVYMITENLTHGYHLVEVTCLSGALVFWNIYYGNIDIKYLKSIVVGGVLATNGTIFSLSSNTLNVNDTATATHIAGHDLYLTWESGVEYKVGSIVQHEGKVLLCKNDHTSSAEFATDYLIGAWDIINAVDLALLESKIATLQSQLDEERRINLEQELEIGYITGRRSNSSSIFTELFNNREQTNTDLSVTNKCDVKDDNDWNDNWKNATEINYSGGIEFKQGFLRPAKQSYYLETVDEFDLEGVGQAHKGALSKYDSNRDCYWMISSASVNGIGEITQISSGMVNGKIDIMSRWYLPAGGSGTTWSGIEVASYETGGVSNDYLFLVLSGVDTASKLVKIPINDDGTIGKAGYQLPNGGSFTLSNLITNQYAADVAQSSQTGYYNDVIDYSSSAVMVLNCNDNTAVSLIYHAKSNLGLSVSSNITGLHKFVGGSTSVGRTISKDENNIYIRANDATDDYRYIYVFSTLTDIVGNVAYQCSGRFNTARNYDSSLSTTGCCEGITVSYDGYVLEATSTTSNGKFISKRALNNALWGENQVSGVFPMIAALTYDNSSTLAPITPKSCMVDASGYFYTADYNTTSDQVRIIRYQSNGTVRKCTVSGVVSANHFNGIVGMCTDNTTVWLLVSNGNPAANWYIFRGPLSELTTQLNANGALTLNTGNWVLCSNDSLVSNEKTGITYDPESNVIYVVNSATNSIDTLTTSGAGSYTSGVYSIPAAARYGSTWGGVAVKDGNIYVVDNYPTSGKSSYVHVVDKNLSSSSVLYRTHMHQDPSATLPASITIYGACFNSNSDLVLTNSARKEFITMKVLENQDVLQLTTLLDRYNVLLSPSVAVTTSIVERYNSPNDFTEFLPVDASGVYDPNNIHHYENIASFRNVPDKSYMAVGYYGDSYGGGFSLLHLDEFLGDRSLTGKNRYDVRKIRVQHYKRGGSSVSNWNVCQGTAYICQALFIERDIVFVGSNAGLNVIDLKTGSATYLEYGNSYSGYTYSGTLSQRNDGLGFSGAYNPELALSAASVNKIHARTFSKSEASEYNGARPKTCVAVATASGGDLLVVNWSEENVRTTMKVWNAVFSGSAVTGSVAVWISQSGRYFGERASSSGQIYYVNKNVYDVSEEGSNSPSTLITPTATGVVWDFALNSRSWKTATGVWKHQLICATSNSTGNPVICIVDPDSSSAEVVHSLVSSGTTYSNCAVFEDSIYSIRTDTGSSGQITDINIYKKYRFSDKSLGASSFWSVNGISATSRPHFDSDIGVSGACRPGSSRSRYCPEQGILVVANGGTRLTLLHLNYQLDSCQHESTEVTCANPDKCVYTQHAIIPL